MNILNLVRWSYWFSSTPAAAGWVKMVLMIVPLVAIFAGIVLKIVQKNSSDSLLKKIYGRFGSAALFFGISFGLWVLVRQQETPIFSARFWPLLIVAITGWWKYCIIGYATKRVPEIRKQNAERMEQEKYLPKNSK